jgi:hypothetical protein
VSETVIDQTPDREGGDDRHHDRLWGELITDRDSTVNAEYPREHSTCSKLFSTIINHIYLYS